MMEHDILFSEAKIGKRVAPNRVVSQAMEANDGDAGGAVSERAIARYKALAEGGWGVVVVEALAVEEMGRARKNGMVINEKNLDGFKRLVDTFKRANPDALLLFQITHSGQKGYTEYGPVSLSPNPPDGKRVLLTDEIEAIRKGFVKGTLLAERAGADGVDFKMCHGYFGGEMLRPSNTRDDKWGGSFENRTRFLRESVTDLKGVLSNDAFIMGSRISAYEGVRGGCGTESPSELIENLKETDEVIRVMAALGMDYVNISAGIPGVTSEITRPTKPSKYLFLHHFRYTARAKKLVVKESLPLSVIGSGYSILKEEAFTLGAENVVKKYTDFVGLGRQSFADPLTPKKVCAGEEVNYCTACGGCSRLMIKQVHDGCILYNDYYKQLNRTTKG